MTQRQRQASEPLDTAHGADGQRRFDVVVPTIGRRSLAPLVMSLLRSLPAGSRLIVVDDRGERRRTGPLPLGAGVADARLCVVEGGGRGPAAARNRGWRSSAAAWIAFLDDDVEVPADWVRALQADLRSAGNDVAAIQGRVLVPLPAERAPSDWERNVHGLETARWITADLAVRRRALEAIGGFDERFAHAYREDSDLALRLLDAGWRLRAGRRQIRHPVGAAPWWVSLPLQRGNADDVLMDRLHGPKWRARAGAPAGAYAAHRVTTGAGALALGAGIAGRRGLAGAAFGWWLLRTARFAWARIAPGPRTPTEVLAMTATSMVIPAAASYHRLAGHLRCLRNRPAPRGGAGSRAGSAF